MTRSTPAPPACISTDKPLHKVDHLVCSVQSIWRAYRINPVAYDLIICDELSSIVEDMTNVTNKHPKENQEALEWFSRNSKRWVGLDAHLMDTCLVLSREYFGEDIRVIINHNRGPRKDAVFIPKPQWAKLDKVRNKACTPGASQKGLEELLRCHLYVRFDVPMLGQGGQNFFRMQ